ncbi:excalibur calcium-binding domain-containing protein [Paenibacillus sp. E222]|nr:excalibur calcium-binding domain-containing protein [Paenibacillus sp. E222]
MKKKLVFTVLATILVANVSVIAVPKAEAKKVYYKNCTAVRKAGKAPLYKGEPGYRKALDRDGDGVACEKK